VGASAQKGLIHVSISKSSTKPLRKVSTAFENSKKVIIKVIEVNTSYTAPLLRSAGEFPSAAVILLLVVVVMPPLPLLMVVMPLHRRWCWCCCCWWKCWHGCWRRRSSVSAAMLWVPLPLLLGCRKCQSQCHRYVVAIAMGVDAVAGASAGATGLGLSPVLVRSLVLVLALVLVAPMLA